MFVSGSSRLIHACRVGERSAEKAIAASRANALLTVLRTANPQLGMGAATAFLTRLGALDSSTGGNGQFLSTHPPLQEAD
jgi:hypothetical protein